MTEQEILNSVQNWAMERIRLQQQGNLFIEETKITIERFGSKFLTHTGEKSIDEFWAKQAEKPVRFMIRLDWIEYGYKRGIYNIIEEETIEDASEEAAYYFIRQLGYRYPKRFCVFDDDEQEEQAESIPQMQQLCFTF